MGGVQRPENVARSGLKPLSPPIIPSLLAVKDLRHFPCVRRRAGIAISTANEGVKVSTLKACVLFLRAMVISKIHLAVENLAL